MGAEASRLSHLVVVLCVKVCFSSNCCRPCVTTCALQKFGMTDHATFGVSFESDDLFIPAAEKKAQTSKKLQDADDSSSNKPGHVLKSLLPAGEALLGKGSVAASAAGTPSPVECSRCSRSVPLSSSTGRVSVTCERGCRLLYLLGWSGRTSTPSCTRTPVVHLCICPNATTRPLLVPHRIAGKKLPIKRAVKYNNLTIDGFSFQLHYNTSGTHGLPPGVVDPKLAQYTVSGIKDAIKR